MLHELNVVFGVFSRIFVYSAVVANIYVLNVMETQFVIKRFPITL